ncbi:MAG: hypothetical protein RBS88_04725 [Spongiibacteraceae bacterium]|jgi:hypothetical protein|nr:hypothetical protein [Spongiibacteraceae bacterium]
MGDVIPFQRRPVKPKSALCANGHHRWVVVRDNPFDSKQGRLVTRYRCSKCGKERVEAR